MPKVGDEKVQRNVLYTGITRAKDKLILISNQETIRKAIRNTNVEKRFSKLKELLGQAYASQEANAAVSVKMENNYELQY